MKISVNEIFGPTIQGEGAFTGVPSVFLRLNGCNLRCAFAGGSICDTAYTSHHPEKLAPKKTTDVAKELIDIFNQHEHVHHLVVTGGEPMLQQTVLLQVIRDLRNKLPYIHVTIETNGTAKPTDEWAKEENIFWSVSPKLDNSCCFEGTDVPVKEQEMHKKNHINYEAVAKMMTSGAGGQLKFVYSADGKTEQYIKDYLEGLERTSQNAVWYWPVMVMPEGQTLEQITRSAKACVEAAIRNGWQVADRLHIRIWGTERGV